MTTSDRVESALAHSRSGVLQSDEETLQKGIAWMKGYSVMLNEWSQTKEIHHTHDSAHMQLENNQD